MVRKINNGGFFFYINSEKIPFPWTILYEFLFKNRKKQRALLSPIFHFDAIKESLLAVKLSCQEFIERNNDPTSPK